MSTAAADAPSHTAQPALRSPPTPSTTGFGPTTGFVEEIPPSTHPKGVTAAAELRILREPAQRPPRAPGDRRKRGPPPSQSLASAGVRPPPARPVRGRPCSPPAAAAGTAASRPLRSGGVPGRAGGALSLEFAVQFPQ